MTSLPRLDLSQRRALCWVTPCIVAWSLIPRLASDTANLSAHQYLFWSSLVSTVCLLACTRALGHWSALRAYSTIDVRRLAALASLGTFGYYALLYSAYAPCRGCPEKAPIIIIAQYTWPAASVLWSAVLLRERLTSRVVVALALGVFAVAVGAHTPGSSLSDLPKLPVVLLAALVFGLYSTLLKRVDYESFSSLALSFGAATVMSAAAACVWSGGVGLPNSREAVRTVMINGLFVNGLSYVCWYRALRAAPITFVAPWVALTPLVAAIVGSTVFHFDYQHWVGIALVLLSVFLATAASTEPGEDFGLNRGAAPHRLSEEST
jgi:drug/metabolite transporter (DMT)-like permease